MISSRFMGVMLFTCLCVLVFVKYTTSSSADVVNSLVDQFMNPYLCTIQFGYLLDEMYGYTFVSACSIIQSRWVLTSSDNLNQQAFPAEEGVKFFQRVKNLFSYAGVTRFQVNVSDTRKEGKGTPWQRRRIINLVFANNSDVFEQQINVTTHTLTESTQYIMFNPQTLDDYLFYPNGKLAWGLSLAETDLAWTWTEYVVPFPVYSDSPKENYDDLRYESQAWDLNPYLVSACHVTSFGLGTYQGVVSRRVAYVPRDRCIGAYCADNLDNCMRYPLYSYFVCFKSLDYLDVCELDQGTVVTCNDIDHAVFGVLVGASDCGVYGLPGVYILMPHAAGFFRDTMKEDLEVRPYEKNITSLHTWLDSRPPFPKVPPS